MLYSLYLFDFVKLQFFFVVFILRRGINSIENADVIQMFCTFIKINFPSLWHSGEIFFLSPPFTFVH